VYVFIFMLFKILLQVCLFPCFVEFYCVIAAEEMIMMEHMEADRRAEAAALMAEAAAERRERSTASQMRSAAMLRQVSLPIVIQTIIRVSRDAAQEGDLRCLSIRYDFPGILYIAQ
jgi:hypothetical protein